MELFNIGNGKVWPFLNAAVGEDSTRLYLSALHVEKDGDVLVTTDGKRMHVVTGNGKLPAMLDGDYALRKAGKVWLAEPKDVGNFPNWAAIVDPCAKYKPGRTTSGKKGGIGTTELILAALAVSGPVQADFVKPLVAMEAWFTVRGKRKGAIQFRTEANGVTFAAYIMPFEMDVAKEKVEEETEKKTP